MSGSCSSSGARFGDQVIGLIERAIIDIYSRHREHVWIEHSINHAEIAMERAGLFEKVERGPRRSASST